MSLLWNIKHRKFMKALNNHFDNCKVCEEITEQLESTLKRHLDETLGKVFKDELMEWEMELLKHSKIHGKPK